MTLSRRETPPWFLPQRLVGCARAWAFQDGSFVLNVTEDLSNAVANLAVLADVVASLEASTKAVSVLRGRVVTKGDKPVRSHTGAASSGGFFFFHLFINILAYVIMCIGRMSRLGSAWVL